MELIREQLQNGHISIIEACRRAADLVIDYPNLEYILRSVDISGETHGSSISRLRADLREAQAEIRNLRAKNAKLS